MAIGDAATAAGYPLVSGSTGLVKDGETEINYTRDLIANVKALVLAIWPISMGGTGASDAAGARTNLGLKGVITISTAAPSGGADGDIHFKYTP